MRTEVYNKGVDSTESCLALIDPFKQHNFKRKNKFNINVGHDQYVVRVFHDDKSDKTYSIVSDVRETKVMKTNLSNFRDTIKEIQAVAKEIFVTRHLNLALIGPFEDKDAFVSKLTF